MTITIPDEVLGGIEVKESDVRLELAVSLFCQERLTLAQAARLAGISRIRFQHFLAVRNIPVHFSTEDWQDDLRTLDQTPIL